MDTARLEIQISLMGKTQERQRTEIQNQAAMQRDLLDQMALLEAQIVLSEAKLAIAEGMLLDEGAHVHSVYEERISQL